MNLPFLSSQTLAKARRPSIFSDSRAPLYEEGDALRPLPPASSCRLGDVQSVVDERDKKYAKTSRVEKEGTR